MNAQTQVSAVTEAPRRSLLVEMATRYGMEPKAFADTLRATVVPRQTSNEEFAAFLMVAKEYNLNPLTKEIYAFPKKGGGIQPIVSIDGWCNLINSHPKLNGIEFDDHIENDGKVGAITARIWRKDRDKPIVVTEYLAECARPTEPWGQYPRRMLRHKALIQCARYAFGFAGIVDPDEAERMGADVSAMRTVAQNGRDAGPPLPPATPAIEHRPQLGDVVHTEGSAEATVIWDEVGERPATVANVPTEQPKQQQGGDVINSVQWRRDAEGALAGCEDGEGLFAVNRNVIQPAKGKVFPPDWQAVMLVYKQTFDRLSMGNG